MRTRRLLAALESAPSIPQPFTLDEFIANLRATRQRPLHMHDLPSGASTAISGLWVATRNADHVFVAPGASGLLRITIVLHEFSHMFLGHGAVGGGAEEAMRMLIGPVLGGAARSRYETKQERDAEKLATLILMQAYTPPQDEGDSLRKIGKTFGYDLGGDDA